MERSREALWVSLPLLLIAAAGCGEDAPTSVMPENTLPTVAAIADQSVIRNTLAPRSVDVAVQITDPDDASHTLDVESSDEAVLASMEVPCAQRSCVVTLTPDASLDSNLTVTVRAVDAAGGGGSASFALRVGPRLVTTTADDGPGSLRRVVSNAEAGDVVGFDTQGAFAGPATIRLLAEIVLDRDATVEGPGQGLLTLSGGAVTGVLEVSSGVAAAVSDLTIADGVAIDGGGVVQRSSSTLTLRRVSVTGNRAARSGGGIANKGGLLLVEESRIVDNEATTGFGGGVLTTGGATGARTRLVATTVAGNRATEGGGVFADATLAIDGGSIEGNVASGRGGGVTILGASATLANASIVGNEATRGGGLAAMDAILRASDTSISDNEALPDGNGVLGYGGGLYVRVADVELERVQVTENTANWGGGLFTDVGVELTILAGDVRNNEATASGGGLLAQGSAPEPSKVALAEGTRIGNNTAAMSGGGIVVGGAVEVDLLSESTIIANRAGKLGGGVFVGSGSDLDVVETFCTILANVAVSGGGIYVPSGGGNIAGVPRARVCLNDPDDIHVD